MCTELEPKRLGGLGEQPRHNFAARKPGLFSLVVEEAGLNCDVSETASNENLTDKQSSKGLITRQEADWLNR